MRGPQHPETNVFYGLTEDMQAMLEPPAALSEEFWSHQRRECQKAIRMAQEAGMDLNMTNNWPARN